MTTPAGLVDHIKHVFVSSPQRDALVRLAESVELLNDRCACVNTILVPEPLPILVELDETELELE